jgi:hypothetical protein
MPNDSEQEDGSALPEPADELSILDVCDSVIKSITSKADKNKRRARATSITLTAATAGVPVSIIFAEWFPTESFLAFFFGRLLPGILAAAAAIVARWVQIEQPHQRWTLYRHWQRFFEAERLRYQHAIGRYSTDDRDDLLAEVLAKGQLELDDQWASLVPRSRDVATEESNRK